MKAKDLAALLLQTPDLEVYIEDYQSQDFGDGYHYTSSTTGVSRTPDGIFISIESCEGYPKSPSEKPQIGALAIMMKDGKWFKLSMNEYNLSTLRSFDECGYICHYIGWGDEYYILAPNDIEDGYVKENIDKTWNTHYTPDAVDYVQVLVGLNDADWTPVYQKFTLEEAVKYAKGEL